MPNATVSVVFCFFVKGSGLKVGAKQERDVHAMLAVCVLGGVCGGCVVGGTGYRRTKPGPTPANSNNTDSKYIK